MLPPTMLVPHADLLYPAQTSPELRRIDMYNRARREEMDAVLYNLSPRHSVSYSGRTRDERETLTVSRLFTGLRNGIGSALITAGNRIHSAA